MSLLERWLEDPARRTWLTRAFYVALGAVALIEVAVPFAVHGDHAHFAFEDWPAWGSLYGLLSCMAIIVGSKLIGKAWLMAPEDYYEGNGRDAAAGDGPHGRQARPRRGRVAP